MCGCRRGNVTKKEKGDDGWTQQREVEWRGGGGGWGEIRERGKEGGGEKKERKKAN